MLRRRTRRRCAARGRVWSGPRAPPSWTSRARRFSRTSTRPGWRLGSCRLRMFDAAIAAGRHGGAAGATQLDERIRDAWTAAEQAANMIEAVYMASGNDPVPGVVTDPLRPWFVGFYASVSRLFRQLDTEDKMLAAAIRSAPLATGPSAMSPTRPGGCHQTASSPALGPLSSSVPATLPPLPGTLPFGRTGPAAGATGPGCRACAETRLQQAADSARAGHLETDVGDDGHRPLPAGPPMSRIGPCSGR